MLYNSSYCECNILFLFSVMAESASGPVLQILRKIYGPIDRCERVFMKMSNLTNMANQVKKIFSMLKYIKYKILNNCILI